MARQRKATGGESAVKGSDARALKLLAPVAKRIDAHMESAGKSDGKANEHRLSASMLMADAKAKCAPLNITFKQWCADNLSVSYDHARKMAKIGESDEPALMLEDLRAYMAKANRESRAKKSPVPAQASESRGSQGRITSVVVSDYQRAMDAMVALTEAQQIMMFESLLSAAGYRVVTKDRVRGDQGLLNEAKASFEALLAGDQASFMDWLPKSGLGKIKPEQGGDPFEIPASMDRRKGKKKARGKKKSA